MDARTSYGKMMEEIEDYGLLGFVISESINEMDNSYEDIGRRLDQIIYDNVDQIDLIEKVIIALTGYCFETLGDKMEYNRDYYNSL